MLLLRGKSGDRLVSEKKGGIRSYPGERLIRREDLIDLKGGDRVIDLKRETGCSDQEGTAEKRGKREPLGKDLIQGVISSSMEKRVLR